VNLKDNLKINFCFHLSGSGRQLTEGQDGTKEIRREVEGKDFSCAVLDKYALKDLPYQVLKLKINLPVMLSGMVERRVDIGNNEMYCYFELKWFFEFW